MCYFMEQSSQFHLKGYYIVPENIVFFFNLKGYYIVAEILCF